MTPTSSWDAADRRRWDRLIGGVTAAWRQGWQPAEVVRHARRTFGAAAARLVTDVIAAEMRGYLPATVADRWRGQLDALGAEVWWRSDDRYLQAWCARERADGAAMNRCAAQVLLLLDTLIRLETLCPLPGTAERDAGPAGAGAAGRWRSETGEGIAPKVLRRVRALLDKAESTDFPSEAEALTARAQELMARHSIDAALLAAAGTAAPEEVAGVRLGIDSPYESPKTLLLQVVARANRCRMVWRRKLGLATVVGFPADLEAVELLFTSLLVQATSAMLREGTRTDARGRSRTRSFRHSFLTGYAYRIGERLRAATDEMVERAAEASAGGGPLPVLAARERAVDIAVSTRFANVARRTVHAGGDREGWLFGRAAADHARLHGRPEIGPAR